MKISVMNARALAAALTTAADAAMAKGEHEFDLGETLSAEAQTALDELQKTIDESRDQT